MGQHAAILAPSGKIISEDEKAFFAEADPWGFILFARNVDHPDQLRRLTGDLRACVNRNAPILIDQEGGRVQRMRAPHWREYLPALDQMRCASDAMRAMRLRSRLIAAELSEVGIDVNCAPLADLLEPSTHPVLLNRLYGSDVDTVVDAARAVVAGLTEGGVLPVLKHIPGYGRAAVDSHLALPRVDVPLAELEARDFAPFRKLNDLALGMTAHIVFDALDPEKPATTSVAAMRYIREQIGFHSLIMTDDISMEALSGTVSQRSREAISAGCDVVLHCNGDLSEMQDVVGAVGELSSVAQERADVALAARKEPVPIDIPAVAAELEALLQ